MKTPLFLLAAACLFSSCTKHIYQVSTLSYTGEFAGESDNITSHENLTITYDFWRQDGMMGFQIQNHTDETMIIDFSRSSVIVGNESFSYGEGQYYNDIVVRPARIDEPGAYVGTISGENRGEQVGIPPGTRMSFSRMQLPVPILATRQTPLSPWVSTNPDLTLEEREIRHRLCTYPDGRPEETVYLEDPFRLEDVMFVNTNSFLSMFNRVEASSQMKSYQGIIFPPTENQIAAGTAFTIIGIIGLTWLAVTVEEE